MQVNLFFTFQMFSQTPSLAKLVLLTLCDTQAIARASDTRAQRISPIDRLPNPLNLINACKYQMQFFGTHHDESQKCRKKKTETIVTKYEIDLWIVTLTKNLHFPLVKNILLQKSFLQYLLFCSNKKKQDQPNVQKQSRTDANVGNGAAFQENGCREQETSHQKENRVSHC